MDRLCFEMKLKEEERRQDGMMIHDPGVTLRRPCLDAPYEVFESEFFLFEVLRTSEMARAFARLVSTI